MSSTSRTRTGNYDLFTNHFFRLPNSGTMWMPDDSTGNYRGIFQYEHLHDLWNSFGKPETGASRSARSRRKCITPPTCV